MTLAQDRRQATIDRILIAAGRALVTRGPEVTMDEIASAAGMSRRTLFRHFPSRDHLLAEALRAGIRRYGNLLPSYNGGIWTAWLYDLCQLVHEKNDSYGLGYFELVTRRDLPDELAAVEARRKQGLGITMKTVAATLWSAAGGRESPPTAVTIAVSAHLSVHFTVAVTAEADRDWKMAAHLASAAIEAVVRRSVDSET